MNRLVSDILRQLVVKVLQDQESQGKTKDEAKTIKDSYWSVEGRRRHHAGSELGLRGLLP